MAQVVGAVSRCTIMHVGAGLLLLITGCTQTWQAGKTTDGKIENIRLAKDRKSFVFERSGKPFVPWGFNYDRDYRMRLLEEYWYDEWATVVSDFAEMQQLGANVVRIHLQFGSFMDGPAATNPRALAQLKRLLELAERTGLYLDITGLACYRKTAVPVWYDQLPEAQRWEAQAHFWEAIARTCRHSPAVFCYDLVNEPVSPRSVRRAGDWLVGEFGGFWYVQAITLDPAGRAPEEVARQWVERMTSAIRKHDQKHLVTLGLLPNSLSRPKSGSGFPPDHVAGSLDFVCVHLYPKRGKVTQEIERLKGFNIGKPVVIEETFPLDCDAEEFSQFILQARQHAAGCIGFYWGQTPAELRQVKEISAGLTLRWLDLFQELNPNITKSDARKKPDP